MELIIKPYEELTRDELFEILKLRNAVFIVEQECPYQDID
ncbi:MAG: GNAT family N-acetyltransferase, partial [Clostridiales bacterium]|nr:GNAT family N-acetyltransferase [Clostridiales bacterium]